MKQIKTNHNDNCNNGCIRKMDVRSVGKGDFKFYKGTLDCPAQVDDSFPEIIEAMQECGCCSFENGTELKRIVDCRFRKGLTDFAECNCHNTMIIYTTCLSKRNHGACPYEFDGSDD